MQVTINISEQVFRNILGTMYWRFDGDDLPKAKQEELTDKLMSNYEIREAVIAAVIGQYETTDLLSEFDMSGVDLGEFLSKEMFDRIYDLGEELVKKLDPKLSK